MSEMSEWGHFTITGVRDAHQINSWAVEYGPGVEIFVPKEMYPDWPRVGERISVMPAAPVLRVERCAIGEQIVWDLSA